MSEAEQTVTKQGIDVILHDGRQKVRLMSGNGEFMLLKEQVAKDGTIKWAGCQNYYGTLEGAINALIRLKVSNAEARSLEDIICNLDRIRKEIGGVFGCHL